MTVPVRLAAALALAALAAGCSGQDVPPSSCPSVQVLGDAADLTRFTPNGQDVTDMVLSARISSVPATCKAGPKGHVLATLKAVITVTRGPAAQGRDALVPYFVAIQNNGQVIEEQDYAVAVTFPPNVGRVTVAGEDILLDIPATAQNPAWQYQVFVAFRLTPEELAYNRRHATR